MKINKEINFILIEEGDKMDVSFSGTNGRIWNTAIHTIVFHNSIDKVYILTPTAYDRLMTWAIVPLTLQQWTKRILQTIKAIPIRGRRGTRYLLDGIARWMVGCRENFLQFKSDFGL